MLHFALDAITGFSFFPLRVMAYASVILAGLAILVAIVISGLRLAYGEQFFGGQATSIVLLLLLSSFQLFFLFILGQYIGRTYDEVRGRPLYIVAESGGFDEIPPYKGSNPPKDYLIADTGGFDDSVTEGAIE